MEKLWAIVNIVSEIVDLSIISVLICVFVYPFIKNKKQIWCVGITHIAVILILYFIPCEMSGMLAYGVGALSAVLVMSVIDRRNITQKIVLVIMLYLFQWISHGVALLPRELMFSLLINPTFMLQRKILQFVMYIITECVFCALKGALLYLMIKLIHKIYVNKKENVTMKELTLIAAMLLAVLMGYLSFSFMSDIYVNDTGNYIWNVHQEYEWIKLAYQLVSFLTILIIIIVYQKIKEKQREEKENAILSEQIENMKIHINEVEKLYANIRGIKHDMSNHIMVLENLFVKNERDELETYLSSLKERWNDTATEIKTGNPITDIILMEKQRESISKGIRFVNEFHYPLETKIAVFDISIILNNALANAIEGACGCHNPYIYVCSYRKKNVYMIEVKNSIINDVEIDEETGLPETTKSNKENHGLGLVNIRKVAREYYGDIDIEQDGESFKLSVMLTT